MQPLNQEIVNDHSKDIGHRSNGHDRQLHGQTAAHGQGDRMKDLLTSAIDAHNTRGKLKMRTKLQLSKNVTMNKPDEKRQGMKVRTVVTGHDAKGRAVFVRDEKVDGTPIPGLGELAFLWNANEPATYPNAGNNPAA